MTARPLRLALTATFVAVGALVFAGPAPAQRAVVDQVGYVSPRLSAEEELEIGYERSGYDGQDEQWSPADAAVLHTRAGSATTVPDWAPMVGLEVLGQPGTPIWTTAQTSAEAQARATVQLGWTRRQLTGGLLGPAGSTGTLRSITGPEGGRLIVYVVNRDDPDPELWFAEVLADSTELPVQLWSGGPENSQRFSPTWAFTRPGVYCLDLEVGATQAGGGLVADRRTLVVAVGDVDPQRAECERDARETTTTLSIAPTGQSEEGAEVTLAAAVAPATAAGTVQFHDGEAPLGDPVRVDGGEARLTTRALERGRHTLRAEFAPDDIEAFAPSAATASPYRVHGVHAYVLETAADERVHADVAARTLGDELALQLKIDAQPTIWKPLDDSILVIPDRARQRVPADPGYRLIGASGSDVWLIDLVQQTGIPWLGISSESIVDSAYQRYTSWRLDGVSGIDGGPPPGEFVLFDAVDGRKPYFSTRTGLPDAVRMLARSSGHWHASWGFTAPGVYCLNFSVANRTAAGAPVGDDGVLTVVVGDGVDPYGIDTCAQRGVRPAGTHRVDPRASGERFVLDSEAGPERTFADLTPRVVDDRLEVPLVVGSPLDGGVAHDLDDVVFRVGLSTARTLPAIEPEGSRVPWVGTVGQPVWEIREDPDTNRYVLGWNTTAMREDLAWRLTGIEGPGEFILHDEWGHRAGRALFSTRPGFAADRHELWPGRRDRASWVFTAPGVYCVGVEWSLGGRVAREQLTFAVGDADPATVRPCGRRGAPPSGGGPPDGTAPPPTTGPRPRVGLSLRVARRTMRIAALRRRGALRVTCGLDAPGSCRVRASISARDASRLRLRAPRGDRADATRGGRRRSPASGRRVTIGEGRATFATAGRRTVIVRLRRAARTALQRVQRRLSIRLVAEARAHGLRTATRSVRLVARR